MTNPHPNDTKGHIHLRMPMARKCAYVKAAHPGKLSAWIFGLLDKASGYDTISGDHAQTDRAEHGTTENTYEK